MISSPNYKNNQNNQNIQNNNITEEKLKQLDEDLKLGIKKFKEKIYTLYYQEFEEKIEKILISKETDFMYQYSTRMRLIIEDLYSSEAFDNSTLSQILRETEKKIYDEIYKKSFQMLSNEYKEFEKSLNKTDNNKSDNNQNKISDLRQSRKPTKISPIRNKSPIFNIIYLKSFRKHCKNTEAPLHKCSGKFLSVFDENKILSYVICTSCKYSYFANSILMYCSHCKEDYYSCHMTNFNKDYQPATWEKYHCGALVNDQMRCIKCRDIFYLRFSDGKLICVNKFCRFEATQESILWGCCLCGKDFKTTAKIYNPMEFKIVKNAIKNSILNKIAVKPNYVPCCEVDIEEYDFFHKNECRGFLYQGEINKKKIVVCSKCKIITNYEKFIWTCPICLKRFKQKESEINNEVCNNENYKPLDTEENANKNKNKNGSSIKDNDRESSVNKQMKKNKNISFSVSRLNEDYNDNDNDDKSDISNIGSQSTNNFSNKNLTNLSSLKNTSPSTTLNSTTPKRNFKTDFNTSNLTNIIHTNSNSNSNANITTKFNIVNPVKRAEIDLSISQHNLGNNLHPRSGSKFMIRTPNRGGNNDYISNFDSDNNLNNLAKSSTGFYQMKDTNNNNNKSSFNNYLNSNPIKINSGIPNNNINNGNNVNNSKNSFYKKNISIADNNIVRPGSSMNNKSNIRYGNSNVKETTTPRHNKDHSFTSEFMVEEIKGRNYLRNSNKEIMMSNNKNNKETQNEESDQNDQNNQNININLNVKNNIYNKTIDIAGEGSFTGSRNKNNSDNKINYKNENPIDKESLSINLNEKIYSKKSPEKISNKNVLDMEKNETNETNEKNVILVNKNSDNQITNINKNTEQNNFAYDGKLKEFIFEDFTLITQIGEGSFGKIYLVEDKNKNIFSMKKIIANDDVDLESFQQEYELVNLVRHNNIMRILGICKRKLDTTTHVLYILMEVGQLDWEKEIRNRQSSKQLYTEKELIDILKQLVSALAFLQSKNISHRDIKPQNVLLFRDGVYKVADFGEAKQISKLETNKQLSTLRGTELYMSPLLFNALRTNQNDIKHNSFRSDVFSLAFCVLYAATLNIHVLYECRNLYESKSVNNLLSKTLKGKFSTGFINILCKMLDINEENRYDFIQLEEIFKELE